MTFPTRNLLSSVCLGLCCAAPAAAAEFKQNFQGRPQLQKSFLQTGPDAARAIKTEPQGVRITLGADHGKKPAVGLVTRFGIRGDFEITLAYDILRVDKPDEGHSAGVSVYVTTATTTRDAATVSRVTYSTGEQFFTTHWATTPVGGQREHHGCIPMPTKAASGRLLLVRQGSMLTYYAYEEGSNTRLALCGYDLGTADLTGVRFAADNGGSPTTVDVRLKSVTIVADDLGAVAMPPPPIRRRVWPYFVLTAVVLAAAGFWLWWRHSRGEPLFALPALRRRG